MRGTRHSSRVPLSDVDPADLGRVRRHTGVILDVLGADGHPPFIVKWLAGGNIAMVDPDPYARVIPAEFG